MDPKHVQAEILALSQAVVPFSEDLSGQLVRASHSLGEQPRRVVAAEEGEEALEPYQEGRNMLDAELEGLPKGRGWWLPPHNLGINEALMGINLWRFTILPLFPKKKGYNERLNGIVIHPIWTSLNNETYDLTPALVTKLLGLARKSPTIQEDVRNELLWLERNFQIRIPDNVKASIIKDALKTAKRRWSVDRLRVKDRLVPLDGSAPYDLSRW